MALVNDDANYARMIKNLTNLNNIDVYECKKNKKLFIKFEDFRNFCMQLKEPNINTPEFKLYDKLKDIIINKKFNSNKSNYCEMVIDDNIYLMLKFDKIITELLKNFNPLIEYFVNNIQFTKKICHDPHQITYNKIKHTIKKIV